MNLLSFKKLKYRNKKLFGKTRIYKKKYTLKS